MDELLARLSEWVDKSRGLRAPKGYAIALDEFDQLQAKTEVIYDIHRVNEQADSKLGLVMVSNQGPSTLKLGPRSQSRAGIKAVEFSSYNRSELKQILEHRSNRAFQPGAVTEKAIEYVAETVFEEEGDCRQALNILLQAGRRAERQKLSKVSEELVEEVL